MLSPNCTEEGRRRLCRERFSYRITCDALIFMPSSGQYLWVFDYRGLYTDVLGKNVGFLVRLTGGVVKNS